MGLALRTEAAEIRPFDFQLERAFAEDDSALYYAKDGTSKKYLNGSVVKLWLPTSGDSLPTIESGIARITEFFLPAPIDQSGVYFAFTDVPSVLEGTVVVSGGQAEISFPNVSLDFVRGSRQSDAKPGTLPSFDPWVFNLTTEGTTIPSGHCGRTGDQFIPGLRLDLNTGELDLVGSVCGYTVDNDGTPLLRGTVLQTAVPEPGTFSLVGGGLLLILAVARRKSTT
jgi:hypothetical protein